MSTETTSLITFIKTYLLWPIIAPGELAAIILLMVFSLLVTLETNRPNKNWLRGLLRQSYLSNVSLFIVNSVVVSFLSATSLLLLSKHYANQGLLNHLSSPIWRVVVAFLCLDLLLYFWHLACHRFDCLWLFHRVHHSDPTINVTTAFRVHIVELIMATILKSVYLVVLGLDKTLMLVIEALFTGFVMFHHTNISFYGERWLGKLIIAPYLHRAHHSTKRSEHDRNYGAVLSLWDRLFGTLIEVEPIAMGIAAPSPQSALGLISFGFGYTPNPAPEPAQIDYVNANLDEMIAEAAYYKAEKRAFSPGSELSDWLEAKREILRLVYGN